MTSTVEAQSQTIEHHVGQKLRFGGRLRRFLSSRKPSSEGTHPLIVTREDRPDGSFILRTDVDGKHVEYWSDYVYNRGIFEPGPLIQALHRKMRGDNDTLKISVENHTQAIGIRYPSGEAKVIYRGKDSGTFSVEHAFSADGQIQKVIKPRGEDLTCEGITPEAGKRLLATSIREYKKMTHLLGVKGQERRPR
jgi:hypothetical protein